MKMGEKAWYCPPVELWGKGPKPYPPRRWEAACWFGSGTFPNKSQPPPCYWCAPPLYPKICRKRWERVRKGWENERVGFFFFFCNLPTFRYKRTYTYVYIHAWNFNCNVTENLTSIRDHVWSRMRCGTNKASYQYAHQEYEGMIYVSPI